ncbi:branched-chain amino acid ABC transporter substrate-binding protein [Alteribacillus sp. HJP-4]|uniref:branched-chain amino acid ABC transporter substrate-binding protein n=1 Tax=Alteribacillus sp. HJP-4 TaxID=2775394 RepID=UPI0035CD251F
MSKNQIKIGASAALKKINGPLTPLTPQFYYGAKLAVDNWNKYHALKAKIVWSDDEASKEKALRAAEHLANQEVKGVVGHFSSECALNAAPIYMDKGIPLLLPAATNPSLTEFKNVFRLCSRDDQTSPLILDQSINYLQANRIALIDDKSYYGLNHIGYIENDIVNLNNRNIKTIKLTWEANSKDQGLIQKLLSFSPELIIFSGRFHIAVEFTNTIRNILPNIPIIFGDDVIVKDYADSLNCTPDNIWAVGPPSIPENSNAKQFINEYEEIVGLKPGFYAASTYAAVEVLLQSINNADNLDQDLLTVINENSFSTILGKIKFTKNGEMLNAPLSLWKLEGQKFTITQ